MRQTFAPGAPTVRRTARRTLPGITGLALLLPALLGGCDAIYDDTKGWAGRLETSILKTAHEMAEPTPEAAPEASPAPDAAAGGTQPETAAPPAVPVEPVDTAALDAPELQPSLAPPAATPQSAINHAPDGVMAAASDALLTGQAEAPADPAAATPPEPQAAMPPQTQAAMPPKPEAKPEMPAAAAQAPAPEATPAAEADAAHAMVLHLSSLRSEEAAKREWSDLQHSFPEPLGQMHAEFRRADLGEKGTFYRVLAGPLPSREEAKQVCAALKAKDAKQYCRILPSKPKA